MGDKTNSTQINKQHRYATACREDGTIVIDSLVDVHGPIAIQNGECSVCGRTFVKVFVFRELTLCDGNEATDAHECSKECLAEDSFKFDGDAFIDGPMVIHEGECRVCERSAAKIYQYERLRYTTNIDQLLDLYDDVFH